MKHSNKSPRWLKSLVLGLLSILVIVVLISMLSDDESKKYVLPANAVAPKADFSELLVSDIRKDTLYHVKAAKIYGGILYVAATNLEKGGEGGDAAYFLTAYNLDSNRNISKCLIYRWTKKDSEETIFEKKEPVGFNLPTWRREEIISNWADKNLSKGDGSCSAVTQYLNENLNDADSYEHVETKYIYQTGEDNFRVICTYRAKNAFGAKILNHIVAIVSDEGALISTKDID